MSLLWRLRVRVQFPRQQGQQSLLALLVEVVESKIHLKQD
jgi:hypothetical protein